jgi:hypothetical protein
MRKSILTVVLVAVLLLFLLTGCVFPGTGTLHIRNEMTACRSITALYLYKESDQDRGSSIISSPLCPNEGHTEGMVDPGEYIIEAEIDNGAETATRNQSVEEGTYHIVHIYDSNILYVNSHDIVDILMVLNSHNIVDTTIELNNFFMRHSPKTLESEHEEKEYKEARYRFISRRFTT